MSTAFAQFIIQKLTIIGIMILLDAVTFVYPLHIAKMSSHWNSFECIKSSGPGASNAGGGKKPQLFLTGFLLINVAFWLLKSTKTPFRPNRSKRSVWGYLF